MCKSKEGIITDVINKQCEGLSKIQKETLLSEVAVNIDIWLHNLRKTSYDALSYEEAIKLDEIEQDIIFNKEN